ncbi:MAG: hypothetical protein L7U52_01225 [Alphaproteobacteria bacterium]|nr:hypothetical protein [Alphaproteobacteria bacterium]
MTNEKTDITSEIEKMSSDAVTEQPKAGRQRGKFQMPSLNIFLWGWFFLSLILLILIAWNYLQEQVYSQGLRTGAQNTSAQIYTDMINKAANGNCNTIFVQYENRRVDLINVRCLQSLNQDGAAATTAQETEQK